jgi:hypothetical protein
MLAFRMFSAPQEFIGMIVMAFVIISLIAFTPLQTHSKAGDDDPSTYRTDKLDTKGSEENTESEIRIRGDQIIYCEGDLSSCHNVLTNIICSNVKYCIVGDVTPFVMSNPL